MKTSRIAQQYYVDKKELESFIVNNGLKYSAGLMGFDLDDSYNVEEVIANFKQYKDQQAAAAKAEQEARAQFEAEKKNAMASMLITSGFNFDGYTITKYSGYISGDDVVEIPRGTKGAIFDSATKVGDALSNALVQIRRNALRELKEAAFALGCNAVVGVDFDYITLDPQTSNGAFSAQNERTIYLPYVFCVTANGNAVVIEKDE